MTERVIARKGLVQYGQGDTCIKVDGLQPDPNAPSIEEIVRVMRQAQVEVFPTSSTASKLGSLIARLDGGET